VPNIIISGQVTETAGVMVGVTVRITGDALATDVTNGMGNYSIDTGLADTAAHDFVVTVDGQAGRLVAPGTPHPKLLTTTAGVALYGVSFQFTGPSTKECFRPISKWVHKICWVPPDKIQITFHKAKVPYVTVQYPNSTYAQYEAFLLIASKGKHVWDYYYLHPYIRIGLDI